ncbi:MAG: PQQ-binding-like beta-propeller repeat protein [Bryobacteraceae bacterium]
MIFRSTLLLCAISAVTFAADPVAGDAVYTKRCATCHDRAGERVPPKAALQNLTATRILRALDFGVMINVAYPMTRAEREAVSTYLGRSGPEPGPPATAFCKDRNIKINDSSKFNWNGWSPTSDNARYVSTDVAGITLSQIGKLKLKWAFAFDGDINAFAQPTVLDGHVFVGSAGGVIHALRADSGCLEWTFQANGPVRAAIAAAPLNGKHALVFSDLTGWVYSLEAETGKLRWKKRIEEHEASRLTAAALIHNGVAYVPAASWEETRSLNPDYQCCTFRGSVTALRIADGTQVWKTYMIPTLPKQTGKNKVGTPQFGPSGAGIWSTPTLDARRNRIYLTTGDNYSTPATNMSDAIVALDIPSGKVLWAKQTTPNDSYNSSCGNKEKISCPEEDGPDHDYGAAAILARTSAGRDLVIAGQKSGVVYAVDPDKNGEIVWQARVGKGGTIGGVQWGMSSDGQLVYAAVSDARFTQTPTARVLDAKEGGGLTALRIADGSKAWFAAPTPCPPNAKNCAPAQSAAITAIPGAVFSGSVDGHLRAFSTEEGKVLWDINTIREYNAVNGIKGNGGSLDGPGPVIVNGMLFVNSGYSRYGGVPGNMLLAFSAQ